VLWGSLASGKVDTFPLHAPFGVSGDRISIFFHAASEG